MAEARGTYGEDEKCIQGFRWGKPRKMDHLEDLGLDRDIILKGIFKKYEGT